MTEKLQSIKNTMQFAKKTEAVVKMMKAFSSAKIREFHSSSQALQEYQKIIDHNFAVMQRHQCVPEFRSQQAKKDITDYIIIGSDHGMVGRFNDSLVRYIFNNFAPKNDANLIVIGKMIASHFPDRKRSKFFAAPLSVDRIPQLIGDLLNEIHQSQEGLPEFRLSVFYNKPSDHYLYEKEHRSLLPLSHSAIASHIDASWETKQIPEMIGSCTQAVIEEFLYISLFRMCTDSLLAEHATRLASMQEAEKNIAELLDEKEHEYNQIRQDLIDRELFDLISGYQSLFSDSERN